MSLLLACEKNISFKVQTYLIWIQNFMNISLMSMRQNEFHLVKIDFQLIFKEEHFIHIISELELACVSCRHNLFLIQEVGYFFRGGFIFPHISEPCLTSVNSNRNMTYQYYLEQPKQMYEVAPTRELDENCFPKNALVRSSSLIL